MVIFDSFWGGQEYRVNRRGAGYVSILLGLSRVLVTRSIIASVIEAVHSLKLTWPLKCPYKKVTGATTPISEDAPGRGPTVYTISMTKARALRVKVLQGFNTWVCSLWLRLRISTPMCICVVFVACSGEFGQERCCGDSELKLFIVFFR